ncbi:MAG TPA: DNA replication protein [Stellaceae bacterium]|nr:DNA replication protein [Stellaceae bacterium]
MTEQLALPLPPRRPASGRGDFLVAPANEAAVAWLDRWPQWPGPALVLAGPAGCGKSHLARVFEARSGAVLLEPEGLAAALPDLTARVAVLDRADAADEESLLHLYNLLAEQGGHLLILAREPPSRWGIRLADLRSRLLAAPVAILLQPDDALLAGLLVKLFADRQLAVEDKLVYFLVARMERSCAAAVALVAALDRAALAAKGPVTLALAREALGAKQDN